MIKENKTQEYMPKWASKFSPKRFLSIAEETSPEAEVFNYSGNLKTFSKITTPILAIFGTREEHASNKTPKEMLEILEQKTNSKKLRTILLNNANHAFSGYEKQIVTTIKDFLKSI